MKEMILTRKRIIGVGLVVSVAFVAYAAETPRLMVFFDQNSAKLTPEAQMVINDAAAQALGQPDYRLEVIGHDDSVLPDQQSLALSQERAMETARSLVGKGVPANRILVGGVGSSEPLVPTKRGVSEPQNRFVRIQFVPLAEKKTKAYLQQFK